MIQILRKTEPKHRAESLLTKKRRRSKSNCAIFLIIPLSSKDASLRAVPFSAEEITFAYNTENINAL